MVVVSVAEECDLGLRHMTIPIVIDFGLLDFG